MPFVVAEFDPREISFFHHARAFRRCDPPRTTTPSVYPGLVSAARAVWSTLQPRGRSQWFRPRIDVKLDTRGAAAGVRQFFPDDPVVRSQDGKELADGGSS